MGQWVRQGHHDALAFLGSADFVPLKDVLDASDIAPVHFRVTDRGVRGVDVSENAPTLRGHVCWLTRGTPADKVREQLDEYRDRGAAPAKGRPELRLEARLMREALLNQLRLPGELADVRFVASQWRLPSGRLIDLVGVDVERNSLVLIELKPGPSVSAHQQLASYLREVNRGASELRPFFQRLAATMGELYGAPELVGLHLDTEVRALVACEEEDGVRGAEVQTDLWRWAEMSADALGPQNLDRDRPWTARMRFHQSLYRLRRLGVGYGSQTINGRSRELGNVLEEADAAQGLNFLQPFREQVLAQVHERATSSGVELTRCLSNLLSSQPMCFNLFGPLKLDTRRATRLMNVLLPSEVDEVTDVQIEWPLKSPNDYLKDGTSFDALIRYRRLSDRSSAFIGVETKLADTFSEKEYVPKSSNRYTEVMEASRRWRPERKHLLTHASWNQLWRNHMLAEAVATSGTPEGHQGIFMVVRHPLDTDAAEAIRRYRSLLSDDSNFVDMPLDTLLALWRTAATDDELGWLDDLDDRYADITSSEAAWAAYLESESLA